MRGRKRCLLPHKDGLGTGVAVSGPYAGGGSNPPTGQKGPLRSINAAPVISEFLSKLLSVMIHHGYNIMPSDLCNCVVKPIPKPHKDHTSSDNYWPISLASNLSKVFERAILLSYKKHFVTSDLQFGFRSKFSTSLCTGVMKYVVSKYIHNCSSVYSCLLDASKAFDRVDHATLYIQ